MANPKVIKRRIKSAKNISQITRAMEMVAASKMRRAQIQALSSRPYSENLRNVLYSLLKSSSGLKHKLMEKNQSPKIAVVLVSTEKGLCGSLNTNQFRELRNFTGSLNPENLIFLNVGRKGRDYLLHSHFQIAGDYPEIKEKVTFEETLPVSHFLAQSYSRGEIGKAYILFTNFVSTLSQRPKMVQILPIRAEDISHELGFLEKMEVESQEKFVTVQYLIEPNPREIARSLLPYFLELEVFHYMLEARASEHSARMVAMKNASDNASDIVGELTLEYNNARQSQITAQIAEVATAGLTIQN